MSKANEGLAKTLARVKGSVVALGEMSADDILASMSDEQKTALQASMASQIQTPPGGQSANDTPAGDDGDGAGDDDTVSGGDGDDGQNASLQPAAQSLATNASIHARIQAVAADDGVKGKEAVALALLADDEFVGLSAAGIIKLVGQAAAVTGDDGDGLSAMQRALAGNRNSNIDADGGTGGGSQQQQSASVWDKAIANVIPATAK